MDNSNIEKLTIQQLTEIFRQAGAKDPESWAASEVEEGINQLARFSFLKSITSELLKAGDIHWCDNQIEYNYSEKGDRDYKMVEALKEMIDKDVEKAAIVDLIRAIQYNTLFHICGIIDRAFERDTPINNWGLFEVDDNDNPTRRIGGLHESLYEFDPSNISGI